MPINRRYPAALGASVLPAVLLASCAMPGSEPAPAGSASPSSKPSAITSASASTSPGPGPSVTVTGANQNALLTPLVASITAAPVPVPGTDGRTHLAYELVVENATSSKITLRSVTAKAGDRVLQRLDAKQIPDWLRIFGTPAPPAPSTTFQAAQSGLIWIDAVVEEGDPVPEAVSTEITVSIDPPVPPVLPETLTYSLNVTRVDTRPLPTIAPPLRGRNWLNGNGCCEVTPHRAAVNPLNGRLWVPERFAIDWVQLNSENRIFSGPATQLSSYAYYGADVHAVADGKVVAVLDGLPEQRAGANPSGLTVLEYGGNHVVQDIGGGSFAFYAHLQTGSPSARVKVGDTLRTGEVLGLLGNSGNTSGPHLHFHVMDGPNPLAANGLPYRFAEFELQGRIASTEVIDDMSDNGTPGRYDRSVKAGDRSEEYPMYRDVVTLPR